ncbi:carboxypeptidase-like regulatory domain-containing protein [Geofilum sp. OHC36d9]|uniref:carboxypeptidase-like regulatory domain-containing protein n=1 Tax=Geofilum sp. OHC36d9 TaxID=3458413 RepID=UPI0040333AE0
MGLLFRYCCITIILFVSMCAQAQELVLTGNVIDKNTQSPLPNVLVTIRTPENKIVEFTQTLPDGSYQVNLSGFVENYNINFSMMGYAPQVFTLTKDQQNYNVAMVEKATEIKEVVIKAPGIHERGDTITYIVSSFAEVEDKSLADVLKKMPGIEIEESGQIKYNGVAINKFYIEGKDLLGGRYGLATNNVHQQDVGSVEVMENHQPIKALEDISFSQNPAINIRLKEDAKARWVGTANIGNGVSPFLWNAKVVGMRFTSKMQTLNTYKTNNIGYDVVQETNSFSVDERSYFPKKYRLENYLDEQPDCPSDIDDNRVRFNKSHLISTNNLWSLGKDWDLTSQVSYTNNRQNSTAYSSTKYFLTDSTIITEEGESTVSKQKHLSADVVLNANTSTYYLKNKLNADFSWSDIDMLISGTYPNNQYASIPNRMFSNDLELLKRSGNRAYTLNSFNSWQVKHQNLDILKDDENEQQEINLSAFYTNTNTSLAFYLKPFTLSMKMGVLGLIRFMDSKLTGIPDTLGQMENDLSVNYFTFFVSPQLEFKKDGFEAKFDVPLSFSPYRYRDNILDAKDSVSKFLLAPRLYMRYYFTSRLSASVSASLAQQAFEEQQFYNGLLLQNYRNLSRGLVRFETDTRKILMLNTYYKVPLKAFFVNASVTRSWNDAQQISERSFVGEFIINGLIPQNYATKMWILNGQLSKGLNNSHNVLSVNCLYMTLQGVSFQNQVETSYVSSRLGISSKIKLKLFSWLNTSYELNYGRNDLSVSNTDIHSSSAMLSQVLSGNFIYKEKWYFQLRAEHYNNTISSTASKQLFLADAEFTYNLSSRWELNLSAKNILNQKDYSYSIYDELTRVNKEYVIRSRTFLASVFFRF